MQPQVQVQADPKQDDKIVQAQPQIAKLEPGQIPAVASKINEPVAQKPKEEDSPPIKSEENQANWRAFRERRDLERKAMEEAQKRADQKSAEAEALKAAMEALVNRGTPNNQANDTMSFDNDQEQEAKIERKIQEALRKDREQYRKEQQEREVQEAPRRLLEIHPDFNQVVTTENCDYIDYHYPELAAPFKHMPEGIEKWSAMYKTVKRFVPNTDSKKDMARVERNMSKPGSVSSTAAAQTTGPGTHMLTEERRKSNWERMQRQLKGI